MALDIHRFPVSFSFLGSFHDLARQYHHFGSASLLEDSISFYFAFLLAGDIHLSSWCKFLSGL